MVLQKGEEICENPEMSQEFNQVKIKDYPIISLEHGFRGKIYILTSTIKQNYEEDPRNN